MKFFLQTIFLFSIVILSCNDAEDGLTEKEKATLLLTKKWSVANIILNGTDITDYGYTLTKIEFKKDGTWTCQFGGDILDNAGTWSYVGEELSTINLSGVSTSINLQNQGSNLTLRFEKNGSDPIGGKVKTVNGDYEIFLLPVYPQ
jgi:hypothetical protein